VHWYKISGKCRQLNCEGQHNKNINWVNCLDCGCALYYDKCLVNHRTHGICAKKFRCQTCKMTFHINNTKKPKSITSKGKHIC
jgi:hypothetical protein